jgi:membrane protease YdiL (CAAX protease family)
MFDVAATIALHFAIVLVFAGLLAVTGGKAVRFGPILLGLVCSALYWVVLVASGDLQSHIPLLAGLDWNWTGKAIAIAASLALIAILPSITRTSVGLRWRQADRSLAAAGLCIGLLCAFSWSIEAWAADGRDTSFERLLYQATMPGLDEELFMRGLLLALFVEGFGESRKRFGAAFGSAEIAVTFLFAAGHALRIVGGAIAFDPLVFCVTAVIGAGLAWLRQRTESLVMPVVAHNLINFGNSFF